MWQGRGSSRFAAGGGAVTFLVELSCRQQSPSLNMMKMLSLVEKTATIYPISK
jgi:hypothetical protein